MRLQLKVIPKSSADRVAGWICDRLKVHVTAAPERGKANDAVIDVLSKALGVPRKSIRITSGATSPLKTVEIDGDPALPPRQGGSRPHPSRRGS